MHCMKTSRGITLLEVLVVIVLLAIVLALLLPVLSIAREKARRIACASNLSAIGKAMVLYSDQGGNGGAFPAYYPIPDPSSFPEFDGQMSLTLLYKSFINDVRVFSCPSNPISQDKAKSVVPSSVKGWEEFAFHIEAPTAQFKQSTSYGYSAGHTPNQNKVIIMADHQGTGTKKNSDNHGRDAGQNVLAAGGDVEFRTTVVNDMGVDPKTGEALIDRDIFQPATISPSTRTELESYVR